MMVSCIYTLIAYICFFKHWLTRHYFGWICREQQPQIILLKEGTDTSQGKAQLVSNINACTAVGDVVRTTLGPRGMDKLIHDDKGSVTISNDGATIMKLLDIVHPAAKILVDIAKSQDSEVLFAFDFLAQSQFFTRILVCSFLFYFWNWILNLELDIDRIFDLQCLY